MNYTLVVGVDDYHLRQLAVTWPTWKRHKPSLLKNPMVVFYDQDQVNPRRVVDVVDHPNLQIFAWPMSDYCRYEGGGGSDKWTNPQRVKMLSGFVHVPANHVKTDYWLKIDTDTVATGMDDWVDDLWFNSCPAIVAQPWPYTKPADQMLNLDRWVEQNKDRIRRLSEYPPLNLIPAEGSDLVRHKRIISWCGFFRTNLTGVASLFAEMTAGVGQLPVPSQDGYLWYFASRLQLEIKRVQMKSRGWEHWSSMANVIEASKRAMGG